MEREKIVKHIGSLKGRLLIFGGSYSNLQALQKMQEIAAIEGISSTHIFCTGDVVGYCAQPEETVQHAINWGIHSIAGNVEIQLREGEMDCGCDFRSGSRCDTFSRQWYPYAKDRLSTTSIDWMQDLPDFIQFDYAGKKATVVHGSWFNTSGYVFASTDQKDKAENFAASNSDLILAGHCGLPFASEQDGKIWLNPGVIGMPANDGTTRVWYMILDTDPQGNILYSHHSFEYDNQQAAALMREKYLPEEYAKTLETGLWDNCEILPELETALQGQRICLDMR